jgi:type VI secretion system protein ImpJ
VNRVFPLLNHMARFPQAHPEELYKTLAQFAGELLTFSSSLTLNEIPIYAHNDLTNTFQKLDALIRDLLDTVISSRYLIIPLTNTKPSFHIGKLESERLVDVADFYLSVSSELPAAQVIETVPYKLKVGAPDDVEKILNSALPGVRLSYAAQTPAPIPVRVGNHYFALEPHGAIYERMLKSHSVCIYVPQALIDFKLELIAVFR